MADWWVNEVESILHEVNERRSDEDRKFDVPCNIFAGRALQYASGVDDFKVDPQSNGGDPYMLTGAMGTFLTEHSSIETQAPSGDIRAQWRHIGTADRKRNLEHAQRLANEGYPTRNRS